MKGFGLIEIVIATAVIGTALFSLSFVSILSDRINIAAGNEIVAAFLAEEGLEGMRFLRDSGYQINLASLTPGVLYYVSFNKALLKWEISTTNPGMIDNLFTRVVGVENVERNGSDDIVSGGGIVDPNTKKINVKVFWLERGDTASTTLSIYLTNLFNN